MANPPQPRQREVIHVAKIEAETLLVRTCGTRRSGGLLVELGRLAASSSPEGKQRGFAADVLFRPATISQCRLRVLQWSRHSFGSGFLFLCERFELAALQRVIQTLLVAFFLLLSVLHLMHAIRLGCLAPLRGSSAASLWDGSESARGQTASAMSMARLALALTFDSLASLTGAVDSDCSEPLGGGERASAINCSWELMTSTSGRSLPSPPPDV